jgi:uncharacterized phage protein gp47/JayE
MASQPKPQSYDQLLGDMLASYADKTGVNDFNVGSSVTSFFEVVALVAARSGGDIFQVVRDLSVDRAEGDALRRIATDENLAELPARVASGEVTVSDTSFTKISTKIYAGAKSPNIGSTIILLSDASSFPTTGQVYIGRGTPNIEGPINYTSIAAVGGYYQMTLTSPTSKFHNINEAVVLAQGGVRNIPVNSIVRSPASGSSADINFSVTQAAFILDGETEAPGVKVSAQEPGTQANVPIGAIKEFASSPFPGAAVKNELPFKTGRDTETDEELRIRIKRSRLSRGLGTALAVKNSVIGATPSDEASTVVSAEIVSVSDKTTLFIDDGTGYEAKTEGVGVEYIVDSALGGETDFQLQTGGRQTSVAKAFLESNLTSPFDIIGTDRLSVTVGGITTEHIFSSGDFISEGGATAYEIVASINANSSLDFQASTTEGGKKVVLFAREDENEAIQVSSPTAGRNAATQMGMPSNLVETLLLFKNKQPLSKDGSSAFITSEQQANWSPSISNGDTLILSVDNTAAITYTISNADFIAEGTHASVAASNSLESWVSVLNKKLTGVTAAIVGEQISIVSNLGASDRAQLEIDPASTLVTKGMFTENQGLFAQGKKSDFVFSRNTGQFRLADPLAVGDELTAGSSETEARVSSARILGGTVTLSSNCYVWVLADDSKAGIINTGLITNTLMAVSKPATNVVRYTSSSPSVFANVQVGDYVIIWSSEFNSANRLEGRVNAVTGTTLDLKITPAEYLAAIVESGILYQEGFVVLRSDYVPQKLKVTSGTKSLNTISDELGAQTNDLSFSVSENEILNVKSKTRSSDGAILVVTFDAVAKALSFTAGKSDVSKDSLIAYYETGFKEASFPAFIHTDIATGAAASPPDSYLGSIVTTANLTTSGVDPNVVLGILQPYGSIQDVISTKESVLTDNISGFTVTPDQSPTLKRLRQLDRVYVASPLDFAHDDDVVAVLDGDASNKTFSIPLYRVAKTNTTLANNSTTFNAYDTDGGPTNPFSNYFGASFKFDNFKALMRAKEVLNPAGSQNAILYRSKQWGRSGEKVSVGYIYPTAANAGVGFTALVDKDVKVKISLKSGAPVATSIDGSTEWNVTITPNTPSAGIDQVTFTWNSIGTAPALNALSGGEYVNIAQGSELSVKNTGTYRVSSLLGFTPTATSFTVVAKFGAMVAELNKATLVSNAFSFYQSSATTAQDIQTFVAGSSTLSQFLEATIVNDGGLAGTGTINLSTYEESGFLSDSVYLKDGINWIAATALGSSPQFTFKNTLALPSAVGYAFNQGEEIKLIPTSYEQLARFTSVLAVTGYSTLGGINLVQRSGRLELSTKTLGGSGSVQVVGGFGNSSDAIVLGSSSTVENQYIKTSVASANLQGLHSDQYVKLTASNKQAKETSFGQATSATIQANYPIAGQSTVTLLNRGIDERFFGKPRHHIRTKTRTFKVEKQGDLTCISWNESGTQPFFSKLVNLNDAGGGTINISTVTGTSEVDYVVLTGNMRFSEISIGDLVTIANTSQAENSGVFLVTGVSLDGKTLRVLNPEAVNEYSFGTFTITNNADISGDTFSVGGNNLIAGTSFAVGATAADSATNLASTISALPGVTASASSNIVTVVATTLNASVAISYTNSVGAAGATASGASLAGRPYSANDFSCVSSVSEGDTVIVKSPFDVLNQGYFRVIRTYNNSIYIDNSSSVDEEVTLPLNSIPLNFGIGSTQFNVDASSASLKLSWNGTGTEPTLLSNAKAGDELTLGTDFNTANRGTFMVLRSQPKKQEITAITLPGAAFITSGQYFKIYSANNANSYYVWFNKAGAGGDPAPIGFSPIQVNIGATDSSSQVASATALAIDAMAPLIASASSSVVTVTTVGYGPTSNAVNFDVGGAFAAEVLQQGQYQFIECINPAAVTESNVILNNVLECHRPPILFYEYDASAKNDSLIIAGTFLGSTNQGSWTIQEIVDQDTVIVSGVMAAQTNTNFGFDSESVFVEEGTAYTGYKKIRLVTIDPANTNRGIIVFDTRYQANKIEEDGGVSISAVGKLSFSTVLRKGLDSYRYHTGLIGEANRIVYGDPRDSATYPGTGAAGAEIFIREPLIRRVSVSIDVRIETGIPFSQISEQVRTNVSSLIDSNPIGQSIAISDIISTVNSIPGVRAVAISSPLYNSANDTIKINTSEKARIIDPINDISVSSIG